ncbi:MAG: ABC transporter permease [Saccharofermentanales bacterium]
MMKLVRFHLYGMKMAFFSSAAYRMDFFTGLLVMLAGTLLSPLLIIIIYQNGATLGNYSVYQIFLMQGIYLIVTGFGSILFFDIVFDTTFRVREGTLDILLLKPQSLLSNLIATNYNNGGIANILGGSLLFAYALYHLPAVAFRQCIFFIISIFFALAILFAFSVILAALGIVWIGNSRLFDIYNSISKFASYPMTIFSKPIRAILSFFIPVAMLGFIPASLLSRPVDPSVYITAASSIVFVASSLLFWRIMIKRYTSAGG